MARGPPARGIAPTDGRPRRPPTRWRERPGRRARQRRRGPPSGSLDRLSRQVAAWIAYPPHGPRHQLHPTPQRSIGSDGAVRAWPLWTARGVERPPQGPPPPLLLERHRHPPAGLPSRGWAYGCHVRSRRANGVSSRCVRCTVGRCLARPVAAAPDGRSCLRGEPKRGQGGRRVEWLNRASRLFSDSSPCRAGRRVQAASGSLIVIRLASSVDRSRAPPRPGTADGGGLHRIDSGPGGAPRGPPLGAPRSRPGSGPPA